MKRSIQEANEQSGGIFTGLFKDTGSCADFRDALAIHTKTGNVNDVINLIRSRLSVPGLGFNLVPSIPTIVTSDAKFTQHFITLCNPERTLVDSEWMLFDASNLLLT